MNPADAIRLAESFGELALGEGEWLRLLEELDCLRDDAPSAWTEQQVTIVIWSVGESLRRSLESDRNLRSCPAILDRVEAIAADERFARGREPFVLLLGRYGRSAQADVLVRLLDDDEIAGHALHALRLLGSPDGIFRARVLAESSRTWIRSEARKYLQKVTG